MASTINADTTNGLILTSDTTGNINFQSNGSTVASITSSGIDASGLTGTLPAIDGSALTNLPAPAALSTASGSAPSYSARAWVNFNGTGTVAIRESGNVSSITDNNTGDYTVNFTTAMPDANYGFATSCGDTSAARQASGPVNAAPTSSAFRFQTITSNGATLLDTEFTSVVIFR